MTLLPLCFLGLVCSVLSDVSVDIPADGCQAGDQECSEESALLQAGWNKKPAGLLYAALNGEKENKDFVFATAVQKSAVTCYDYSTLTTGNVFVNTILDIKNATATINYERTESRGYQVSSSFITETFQSLGQDFHAKFGASTSVTLGIPEVGLGGSAGYNLLLEYRLKMQSTFIKSYTENRSISENVNTTVKGSVAPGQSLALYQVIVTMNGAHLNSNFYNYKPTVSALVVPVSLSFNLEPVVPLLRQLGDIRPGSENKKEWSVLRSQYYWAQNEPIDSQVRGMLGAFRYIIPGSSNTKEWTHLREASSRILGMDQAYCHDTVRLFCDLVRGVFPGSSNKKEWQAIRDKADQCLSGLSR